MEVIISLYSNKKNEIERFLKSYDKTLSLGNNLTYEFSFKNPTESADIIGVYIDNKENFNINMWVSLDKGFFINVTEYNADKIIRYLFERYPY